MKHQEILKLSVVFLVHNEKRTIELEINKWIEELKIIEKQFAVEIIVIEDGSKDGTTAILESMTRNQKIKLFSSTERLGYNFALFKGLTKAKGDFVFYCDTGLKNNPKDLHSLLAKCYEADLIVGKKINRKDQIYRKTLTKGLNLLLRFILKNPLIHDADSGFRLMTRKYVDFVISRGLNFRGFAGCEMLILAEFYGFRYLEIPIDYNGRLGKSRSLPPRKIPGAIVRLLIDILVLLREVKEPSRNQ